MEIYFSEKFKKSFKKLSKKIKNQFQIKIDDFIKNPQSQSLKIHPLKGHLLGFRAFSITGDYRVIYKHLTKTKIKLINIGTHNQVY